jgi:hypothetical protein
MGMSAPASRTLGRESETRALAEALDRVASGASAIVLIEGEAGIGKTRLLQDALGDARARGMQVIAGRAEQLERTRPFGLVAAAFGCSSTSPDPRRAAISAVLATQGGGNQGPITVTSDPGLQFRTVDAFADLAEELALSGPLVIGVDDLQWADPSSLLTLATASRRLAYLHFALIGCLRPAPHVADLDRLRRALEAAGARCLALVPLAEGAVQELVADTIAADPGPRLLTEIAGAAGNPLFVTELLGALIQEGAITTAGGRAEVAETTLPPTLRLTILRRLSFLPDDTLEALQAAPILGSAFSLIDLATVADRTALGLASALTEAIRTGVLRDDGAHLRFRHDLIRDAIYEDLPASVRRALHHEAGQRLAQAHAPALLVAEHLARGAGAADAEAVTWLTRAAREAAATSPDVAADLLERAIGLMDPAHRGRDRLLAEQASSLMWAGRITAAKQMCRMLLERTHARDAEGPARLCLGYTLVAQLRQREALPELERAAESPGLTDAERAGAGMGGLCTLVHGGPRRRICHCQGRPVRRPGRSPGHKRRHGHPGPGRRPPSTPGRRARDHRRGGQPGRSEPRQAGSPLSDPCHTRVHPHRARSARRSQVHARHRQTDQRGARNPLAPAQLPDHQRRDPLHCGRMGRCDRRGRGDPGAG